MNRIANTFDKIINFKLSRIYLSTDILSMAIKRSQAPFWLVFFILRMSIMSLVFSLSTKIHHIPQKRSIWWLISIHFTLCIYNILFTLYTICNVMKCRVRFMMIWQWHKLLDWQIRIVTQLSVSFMRKCYGSDRNSEFEIKYLGVTR